MRMQVAMEASSALPSVKLSDLKQRNLYRPLIVSTLPWSPFCIHSTHHTLYVPTSECQFATSMLVIGTELDMCFLSEGWNRIDGSSAILWCQRSHVLLQINLFYCW